MFGVVPLNAGYTVSVPRTRFNVLVLLTLAVAGESPTCILHEGTHPVSRAIEESNAPLAKLSFDQKNILVDLTAEVYFSFFLICGYHL